MSYEFNPDSQQFDVPNPHRIENVFLAFCAIASLVASIALSFSARGAYVDHDVPESARCLIAAAVLFGACARFANRAARQLRFFFGRGQPADLVPSLSGEEVGFKPASGAPRQIRDAEQLRETLQQNAIAYPVPRGPIDTLLYSIVRDLVFSPRLTRLRVESQFRNVLAITTIGICYSIALLGIRNAAATNVIDALFFALTFLIVIRPLARGSQETRRLSQPAVFALGAAAIVGPVVIASFVRPEMLWIRSFIDFHPVAIVEITAALAVSSMMLAAGIATTVRPTRVAIAPHLEKPSMNVTPTQIDTELARQLQDLWTNQIPNRRYMRVLPVITGRQGAFDANVIEETQPIAIERERLTLASSMQTPTTRWLLAVDVACTIAVVVADILVWWGITQTAQLTSAFAGTALLVAAMFGISSANDFWRRFSFVSRVYWIEWSGTYARSSTSIGSIVRDSVHAKREAITVDGMTLRVWVAEIDSVAFNTDRDRDIVAIRGLPDEAARLGRALAAYAEDQSAVTAPISGLDRQRIGFVRAVNARPADTVEAAALDGVSTRPEVIVASGALFCRLCGKKASSDDAFCAGCGTPLARAPDDETAST
jgi:hypothetical protein